MKPDLYLVTILFLLCACSQTGIHAKKNKAQDAVVCWQIDFFDDFDFFNNETGKKHPDTQSVAGRIQQFK